MLVNQPSFHTAIVDGYVAMFRRYCGDAKIRIFKPEIAKLRDGHLYLDIKNNYVENIYLGIERLGNENLGSQRITEQVTVFRYDENLHRYRVDVSGVNNCARYMMGPVVLSVDPKRQREIREYTTALLNNADRAYADLSFRKYWKDIAEAAVQSEFDGDRGSHP